jgi:hypothetical protein
VNQLDKYYTDDERAIFARDKDLEATGKRLSADLAAVDASIAAGEPSDPNPEARLDSIVKNIPLAMPRSWADRRTEIQYGKRDVENARDYLADKIRVANHAAGERLAKHNKPATEAAEKLVAEKFLGFYDAYHASWKMKRNLLNDGIGLYGSFNGSSQIDEFLGIPVDINSRWADLFRDFVAANHIRRMPPALLPK